MDESDWKVLMHDLSIKIQSIHFSKGTTLEMQNAITDHMIAIADFIETYPVPQYVNALARGCANGCRCKKQGVSCDYALIRGALVCQVCDCINQNSP